MHEMSIAESLIDLIEKESERQGFAFVRRVGVRLGVLGSVEPAALLFCFDAVAQGTVAQGARLDMEMVAATGRCPQCRRTVSIVQRYDICPACGQSHVELTTGDELRLMELEVQ